MSNIILPKRFGQQLNLGFWPTDGLLFYWRGIRSDKVVDESLYGNHGTITGATWVGDALSFNGTSDYVTITNPITRYPFTLLTVFKVDGTTDNQSSIALVDVSESDVLYGIDIFLNNLRITARNITFYSATTPFTSLDYVSVAAVFLSDTEKLLYVDGQYKVTLTTSVTFNTTTDIVGLGRYADITPSGYLTGNIRYTSIYNRALSQTEIAALYLNPALPMQQPPIWLFTPPVVGVTPKGPLGHPFHGPFGGPVAA